MMFLVRLTSHHRLFLTFYPATSTAKQRPNNLTTDEASIQFVEYGLTTVMAATASNATNVNQSQHRAEYAERQFPLSLSREIN